MHKSLILLACFFLLATNISFAQNEEEYVAYVNYNKIDDILLEFISINPNYSEIAKEYTEFINQEEKKSKEWQKKIEAGEVDINKIAALMMTTQDPSIKDKVETLLHAELIVIIEELYPKKYKLVLDNSFQDNILYNNTIIPDITSNVRQFLLKKLKQ